MDRFYETLEWRYPTFVFVKLVLMETSIVWIFTKPSAEQNQTLDISIQIFREDQATGGVHPLWKYDPSPLNSFRVLHADIVNKQQSNSGSMTRIIFK